MTAPIIKKDKATIEAATTDLRRITADMPGVTAPIAEAVAAAASKPLPAATAESPALALMRDMAEQLEAITVTAVKDLNAAATAIATWDGGTDNIDEAAVGGVTRQGGGASW